MAQVQLQEKNKVDGCIHLSVFTKVKVTDIGQVEFVVTPKDENIEKTVVHLTSPAWKKLNGVVQEVNSLLKSETPKKFMYHPRTKYIEVKENYGVWQVYLSTYNRKGFYLPEYSVTLSVEEWYNLVVAMKQINKDMKSKNEQRGEYKPREVSVYRWRFIFDEGLLTMGSEWYFDMEHARNQAMQVHLDDSGHVEFETSTVKAPEGLPWMETLYATAINLMCDKLLRLNCPGCKLNKLRDNEEHKGERGCQNNQFDYLGSYFNQAKQLLTDVFLCDVFYYCWNHMLLGVSTPKDYLGAVQFFLNDANLLNEVKNVPRNVHDFTSVQHLIRDGYNKVFYETEFDFSLWSENKD